MAKQNNTPYRIHPKWHDYTERGIYMITLVVQNRDHILGELNMDAQNPGVILTETGTMVEKNWNMIPKYQAKYNRKIKILCCCAMPDHFHGVIFIEEKMDVKLGKVIQGFKSGCTRDWRIINGIEKLPSDIQASHISINRRLDFYATLPRLNRPLFDADFDDTILFKRGQLQNIINYVKDNPRRAILKKLNPTLFQRINTIKISGRCYSAFGNLFLLKAIHKIAVKCHRKDPLTGQPFETTDYFQKYRKEIIEAAADGSVIITPAISKGEQIIRDDCFENGYPLIHIQDKPLGDYHQPEKRRFDICANGKLLIIIPQNLGEMDAVNGVVATAKYSKFHNMNTLAEEIADFHSTAFLQQY